MINKRQISYSAWALSAIVMSYIISASMMDLSTYRAKELTSLIQADVKELSLRPDLKSYFEELYQIQNIGSDSIAGVWAHFVNADLSSKPTGRYKLELLYISQPEDGLKAIVQYHFVDLKSGDSVEEFARYYDLKAFYD
jgi:hypothetical protein